MAKRPRKKGAKKSLTPEQERKRIERNHIRDFRALFKRLGFARIAADGIEIEFKGRRGELDDVFVYENIVIITEYTAGKPKSEHILKKKVLYDKILAHSENFVELAFDWYEGLRNKIGEIYPIESLKIRIVYISLQEPSDQVTDSCPEYFFLHGATAKYFKALAKTIEASARIEFLKFLKFEESQVGEHVLGSANETVTYQGFLLPEGNSSYPSGYKIVSFYADPERLMSKCHVLRRDSWRDGAFLYQRILIPSKIKKMRKYLVEETKVFVNNIIVTLPHGTQLNELDQPGRNKQTNELKRVQPVSVHIPGGFGTIGIVDGQHRVFCYHEGSDKAEATIAKFRKRQNLMVTGIVYPKDATEDIRRRFEAQLFLEINDTQARAKSSLRQDIEVIIRPYSGIAIAKRVIQELGRRGPYKDMLQTNYFDEPSKIKTSSLVSYGLRPLVKLEGSDSLFSVWNNVQKEKLKTAKGDAQLALLDGYVSFCVEKLNEFFLACKLEFGQTSWVLTDPNRSPLLSLTTISGLMACLRKIIENNFSLSETAHRRRLKNLSGVRFSSFKSSDWQRLGTKLFDEHYK